MENLKYTFVEFWTNTTLRTIAINSEENRRLFKFEMDQEAKEFEQPTEAPVLMI